MRLQIKKIAAASMIALSMMTVSTYANNGSESLLDPGPKVVYAAENKISSDAISALDKINSVQNDGDNPGTTKE